MLPRIKYFIYQFFPSSSAWRGAAIGVIVATLLLCLASTVDLLQNNVSFGDATLYFFGGAFAIGILGGILVLAWLAFISIPRLYKWAVACFAFVVYYFFIPPQTSLGITLIAIWTVITFSLIGGSLWSLIFSPKQHSSRFALFTVLAIGSLSLIVLSLWLIQKNTPFLPPAEFDGDVKIALLDLPNPGLPGPWQTATLSYGSGHDLHRPEFGEKAALLTNPFDSSPFITGWDGLQGKLRTRYWGFDAAKLPLNGLVWYPQGEGPFPLVLIVHGNHEMSAPSDTGYAYLGKLLSSQGFIVVSIDENFLNGSWIDFISNMNELAARGMLILEHLNQWREWNNEEGNLFYKKVDMDMIALIGHSRGGEAIATAAAFNPLSHDPEDGTILFNYNFNIRALAAIAPVDGQYLPGGIKIALKNIDYFVIHGSHDGDVRSFEGSAQYNRIYFTDPAYHFKASLLIYGANHGQFNTVWGKKDNPPPSDVLFDLGQIMPAAKQQEIAKIYLSAFLKSSLQGQTGYLPLFRTYHSGQQWLPKTLYINEFADSTYQYVLNEKKDIDIAKGTLPGSTISGENLEVWRQSEIFTKEGTSLGVDTVIEWSAPSEGEQIPSFTISLQKEGLKLTSDTILVLSLANGLSEKDKTLASTESDPVDFSIELTDHHGVSSKVPLSEYAYLRPVLHINVMKAAFLDPLSNTEYLFQNFEFPLSLFMKDHPDFDPNSLQSIRLVFDRTPAATMILQSIAFRE